MWICTKCATTARSGQLTCPACGAPTRPLYQDTSIFGAGFTIGSIVTLILLLVYSNPFGREVRGQGYTIMGLCTLGGFIGGYLILAGAALHRWLYRLRQKEQAPGNRRNLAENNTAIQCAEQFETDTHVHRKDTRPCL